ncbi:MAG: DUF547 domain-containing protein [Bacteroidetes bacterium]|nr:MAG: DUF547 domain-containing protein [Bacteroidota bacterium]TDI81169.1 MAG: DUF547 domain-containing protein [Bacteroidota bacterium]
MKKLFILTFLFVAFSVSEGHSQTVQSFFDEADALFKSYVSDGKVDYAAIKNNPDKLNSVLETAKHISVSINDPKVYQAFWINAYNLAVIKGIIDNYPIKSPLDKKGFFDKTKYDLGGTSITLNDIENKNLRAQFDDARFHFVLVCGALGCPPIISKSYTASNLENLLEQQTINALNDNTFIKVTEKIVAFSEIFKWYKEDFVKEGQTEIDFLNDYRIEKVPKDAKVTYYSYDWRLNSK